MRTHLLIRVGFITGLVSVVVAAAPPEDRLREGNAAFERGEYLAALEHYRQAENLATDPGKVAFNLAAIHYQLKQYLEAAINYERALEDAEGVRRVQAFYGLGNALAQHGHKKDGRLGVDLLTRARTSYEECLRLEESLAEAERALCGDAFTHAKQNLDLIVPLLQKKRAALPKDDNAVSKPPNEPNNPNSKPKEPAIGPRTGTSTNPRERPERAIPRPGGTRPMNIQQPQVTSEYLAGKGNLSPLLDDHNAPRIDSDQALEHLRQNVHRVRQSQAHRDPLESFKSRVTRDW